MLRTFLLASLCIFFCCPFVSAQSSFDPLKASCFDQGLEAIEKFADFLCAPDRRSNEFPGCGTAIAPSQALRLDRCNDFDWLAWQLIWDEDVYSRADYNIAIISLCTAPNLDNPSFRDTLALKFNFDITRLENGSDSICMRSVATQEIIGFDGQRENSMNAIHAFDDAPRTYGYLNKAYRLTRRHYLNDVQARVQQIIQEMEGDVSLQRFERIQSEVSDLKNLNRFMVYPFDRAAFNQYKGQIENISYDVGKRIEKLESLRKAETVAALEKGFKLAECGQLLEGILLLRPIVESDDFKDNEKKEEFERIDRLESLERRGREIVQDNRTDEYLDQELRGMPGEWRHYFRGLLFFSKSQAKTNVGKPAVIRKLLDSAYVNCEKSIQLKPCFIPSANLRIDVNRAYENLDIPHWREAQVAENEEALTVWSDQVLPEMIRDYKQVCPNISSKEGIIKAKEAHFFFTSQSQPIYGLQVLEATVDTAAIRHGDERMTRFSLYYINQLIEIQQISEAKKWMADLKNLLPDLDEQDDYLKQTVLIAISEGPEAVERSIRNLRTEIGAKANEILDLISDQIEMEAQEFRKRGLHQTAYFHLKRDPVLITQQTNSPEKLERLGDYALNANYPEEADSIWSASLELFPRKEDQNRIQRKIAQALLDAGLEVRNAAELTTIAKGEKAEFRSKLVYMRYTGTDKSLSAKEFYKSIRKDPDLKSSDKAEARYIYLAQALGKKRAGLGAMERWQEEMNTAESLFELACAHLEWHPKNERIFDLQGVGKQNIDEAESLFMACLKEGSQRPSEWLLRRYLGYLALRTGQVRDAIEHFTLATAQEPSEHIEIHLELIRLHFGNQEYDKAMEVWDRLEDKAMLTCINGDEESLAFRLLTKTLAELPVPQKRLLFFNKSTNDGPDKPAIEPYRRCLKIVDKNDGVMKTLATLTYKVFVKRSQSCGTEINAFENAVEQLHAPIDLVDLKALSATRAIQEIRKRFPAFDLSWKALENKQKQLLKES